MSGGNSHQRAIARAAQTRIKNHAPNEAPPPQLNQPAAEPPQANQRSIGDHIWSWPVVGGSLFFIWRCAFGFMTTGHRVLADIFYLAGAGLLIAKFVTWGHVFKEGRRTLALGPCGIVALVAIAIWGNHRLNPKAASPTPSAGAKPSSPAPAPAPPESVRTILVRYQSAKLPISIPPQTTAYILRLNPSVTEGLLEETNGNPSNYQPWPDQKAPFESIYGCEFRGESSLLDIALSFDISFYSVDVTTHSGGVKKNRDGTVTYEGLPLPGATPGDVQDFVYELVTPDGIVTEMRPRELVSTHKHRIVIPFFSAGQPQRVYLVNESKFFVRFTLPERGTSVASGNPSGEPTILIRPDVNVIDKIPENILPPSSRHWPDMPSAQ